MDDDSSLYATELELLGQFLAILDQLKHKQKLKKLLMQHLVQESGSSSSSIGSDGVRAASPVVGVCSNNASSGSRAVCRDQQQQHQQTLPVVMEPSELKLRLKLVTWMSETGELIVQPSLLPDSAVENKACDAAGTVVGAAGAGGTGAGTGAGAGAGASGAGAGNGNDFNSCRSNNDRSRSSSADTRSKNGSQQKRIAISRGSSNSLQKQLLQQNSGDLPQHAAVGIQKTGGRSHTYKDLGVIQGQQYHQQLHQHQQQHQQKHQQKHQQQHQQQHQQLHQQEGTHKAEKKVANAKKDANAGAMFAGDSALQRSCQHCSYHRAA